MCLLFSDWWPLLRIGAVNCASEINVELCRSFQINGIPAFKVSYSGADNLVVLFKYYYTPAQQSCKGGILESASLAVRWLFLDRPIT